MTLQVGDKTVVIPLRDGGRVAVRSGTIAVGDKAVLIPGANGQFYAVKPASPQVGDRVILYPLRNGGHVCLASADDEGGSSPSVMPPGNFYAWRTGPSTADLEWLPGEGNTAVRIVRRSDRYPVHINDGTVVYEGAGDETTDTGLDFRLMYYYCAWGKAGSKYSNGYMMDQIGAYGIGPGCLVWINASGNYPASAFGSFVDAVNGDTLSRVHFSQIDLSKYRTIYFLISSLASGAFLDSDDASRVREWYGMGGRIFLTCEDRNFAQADFNRIGGIVGVSISGSQFTADNECITSPSSSDLLQGVSKILGANSEGVLSGGTAVWSGHIHRGARWVADGSFTRFSDDFLSCDRSTYWSNIRSYLG